MLHRLSNEYYLNIRKTKPKTPKQKKKTPHTPSGPSPTKEKLRQASEIGIIEGSLQLTSAF